MYLWLQKICYYPVVWQVLILMSKFNCSQFGYYEHNSIYMYFLVKTCNYITETNVTTFYPLMGVVGIYSCQQVQATLVSVLWKRHFTIEFLLSGCMVMTVWKFVLNSFYIGLIVGRNIYGPVLNWINNVFSLVRNLMYKCIIIVFIVYIHLYCYWLQLTSFKRYKQ